ncbi:MAG: hypothetical protein J7L82_03210 [Staphylothermus sp.]|nr:hypothetical protein [Staphylothermus sp.]
MSNHRLSLLATIAIVSLPVILPWCITVLLDLPQHYFILVSTFFILKSIRTDKGVPKDIDPYKFILGIMYAFLSILFKANMLILATLIIVTIAELYRNRNNLVKRAKVITRVLMMLLFMATIYVLIFDFGHFISWYFFNDWRLANTLKRYIIYEWSIADGLISIFVEFPWDHYTVFSYSWKQWLDLVNFALAPEALTILFSSAFFILPFLTVKIRSLRFDIRFRILAVSTWVSFWLYFFILVGNNQLHDFTRFVLCTYILSMILSVTALQRALQSDDAFKTFALVTLSMIILLFVNHMVTLEFGGTRFFPVMERYRYSFVMLLAQTGFIIIYIMTSRDSIKLRKFFLIIFLLVSLVFFPIFNNVVFSRSLLFSENTLEDIRQKLETMDVNTDVKPCIVVSNFYIYLRNYVDLRRFVPIPLPIAEDEFKEMLKLLPEGSIIVLTNDPRLSWYEYGNWYVKKYLNEEFIPIEYLGLYKAPAEPQIELLFNESIKIPSGVSIAINGSYVDTRWGKAVALDGVDDFIALYNYTSGNLYTLELLFKMDEDPIEFGVYPENVPGKGGQPVEKILLAKRWGGYIEIIMTITSRGQITVYADNNEDKPRFEIRTGKGIIRKGEWYHLLLVVNNTHARLYINGILVGESKVNGENMVLEEKSVREEPLYIGADGTSDYKPWRYLRATIKLLRIYDKVLSQEEIATFYAHIKRVAIIKHGDYVYAIYVKEGVSNREPASSVVSKIKLIDAVMNPEGTCVLKIDSSLNSSIVLGTVRFSKIVNILKEAQTLSFPYYYSNSNTGIRIAKYLCTYHIALDSSGNTLWVYVKHGINSGELLVYYTILLIILLILTITSMCFKDNFTKMNTYL